MVLYLGENDVRQLLDMTAAVDVLEDTFRQQGSRNVLNNPSYGL